MTAVRAGVWYFVILFAAGVVLGTLRTLLVAPLSGELSAVLLEIPLMLLLSWMVAARLTARDAVAARPVPRLVMGGVAFALLMVAELVLSLSLFGRDPSAHLAHYATPAGAAGVAAQLVFAMIPLLHGLRAAARIKDADRH